MLNLRLHHLIPLLLALPLGAAIPETQRSQIDAATGAKGSYTAEEDVYRVKFFLFLIFYFISFFFGSVIYSLPDAFYWYLYL